MSYPISRPLFSLGGPLPPSLLNDLQTRWAREGARFFVSSRRKRKTVCDTLSLEELLAWSAEWGRSEFRLLEIILDWLWFHWKQVSPSLLNGWIQKMPTPAVWGVLYEWTLLRKKEMSPAQDAFWTLILDTIQPAEGKLFFSEGKLVSFSLSKNLILKNLEIYKRWGFIGDTLPSISEWKRLKIKLSKKDRMKVLRVLAERGPVYLKRYLQALDYKISRQTGWRDLQGARFLRSRGQTKAKRYVLIRSFTSTPSNFRN